MPLPSNPTNGQTAILNNISYTYNSSKGSWAKTSVGADSVQFMTTSGGTFSGPVTFFSTITANSTASVAGLITANTGINGAVNGRIGENTPNTAAFTTVTASGNVSAANLTITGSVIKNNRTTTPWYNVVTDYGADPTGSADSATAINNAIAAANSTGYPIYFPAGTYKVGSSLTALTDNGQQIKGDGRWNTIIAPSFASGDVFTLQAQFQSIEDLAIQASVFRTSGYDIKVNASNCLIRNIFHTFSYNGIWVVDSSESIIENVQFRYMTGTSGLYFSGTVAAGSYGLRIKNIVADNPYIISVFNANLKNEFSASTAYSLGDIFVANGWIWQVTTAGTTGLTAPSAPASTSWYSTSVTNGTAQLRAICSSSLTWITMDNYSNSMTILEAALIDGACGLRMQNTSGITSAAPNWIFAYDLEIDHPYSVGIDLQRGYGFHGTGCWIGSTFIGNGIQADSNFSGEILLNGCRVAANGQNGVLMNGCPDWKMQSNFVFDNGINSSQSGLPAYFAPGTFHDLNIAANSFGFTVSANSFGFQKYTGNTTPWTGYAVYIGSGCERFSVIGNMSRGNRTGNIFNASGTGITRIVANTNAW